MPRNNVTCPVCDGNGEVRESVANEVREWNDVNDEAQNHAELFSYLIGALGQIAELDGDCEQQNFKLTRFQTSQIARAAIAKATGTYDLPGEDLEAIKRQRDYLLSACRLALHKIGAPITHAQDVRESLVHAIDMASGKTCAQLVAEQHERKKDIPL